MDLLKICVLCKRNLANQSCKICGKIICLNCGKKGFCKDCYPSVNLH